MIGFVATLVIASSLTAIPPPPRGHWTVDQTGRVPSAALEEIDRIAGEVDASGAGQLGALVVRTTSGAAPRAFATRVSTSGAWGTRERTTAFCSSWPRTTAKRKSSSGTAVG